MKEKSISIIQVSMIMPKVKLHWHSLSKLLMMHYKADCSIAAFSPQRKWNSHHKGAFSQLRENNYKRLFQGCIRNTES